MLCYYEINIENINNNVIIGNFIQKKDLKQTIKFNIKIIESNNILIFKSTYQTIDREQTEIDTFVIINQEEKSYFTPKTKYLIHLVDDKIKQAYTVNKKYKFTNGINENYFKINIENKEIFNNIKKQYELKTTNKTR